MTLQILSSTIYATSIYILKLHLSFGNDKISNVQEICLLQVFQHSNIICVFQMAHMFGFFFTRARRDRTSKGQGTIKLGGHMKKEVYMVGDPRDFATTTPLI